MQVKNAVEEYRFSILNISEKTQGFYLQKLQRFAEWCEQEGIALEDMNQKQVARYIEYRRKQGRLDARGKPTGTPHSTYTLQGDARAIKVFLNWCAKDNDLEKLVAEKTVKRIAIPKIEQKIIETFTTLQIQALLEACHQNSNKAYAERDRTIVALLLDTGIRAGELCTLTLDNLYLDNPHDAYIRVHGKGDKWREVGLGVETLKMLRKYLAHQRKNAGEQAYVFPGHGEGQLTINALDHVFYRLEERAQITGVRCSPHTMRHTFAMRYLEAGGDVYRLSRLMGHTTIRITEGYLRAIKEREARQAGISVMDRMIREKPKSKKAPALKVVKNNPPLERFSVIDNL